MKRPGTTVALFLGSFSSWVEGRKASQEILRWQSKSGSLIQSFRGVENERDEKKNEVFYGTL